MVTKPHYASIALAVFSLKREVREVQREIDRNVFEGAEYIALNHIKSLEEVIDFLLKETE